MSFGWVAYRSFLLKTVAGFRIAGQEVIRAHRLLKNKVRSDEYLILPSPSQFLPVRKPPRR